MGIGIAIALAVTSAAVSAASAQQQGKDAKRQADYNAAVEQRNAEAARMKAEFDMKRQAKEANRIKGKQTAAIAAGGGLGSPVAADLAAEQAEELELDNMLIGYEGEVAAMRHESQASMDKMAGRAALSRGRMGAVAGYTAAGSSLLTGFAAGSSSQKVPYSRTSKGID